MKNITYIYTIVIAFFATAVVSSNLFSPFIDPFLSNFFGISNHTRNNELRRRQGTDCPNGYGNNCAGIGAAGVCCPDGSVCSIDSAGHAACCPSGAVCTGSIKSTVMTKATITSSKGSDSDSTTVGGVIIGGNGDSTSTSFNFVTTTVATTTASDGATTTTTETSTGAFIIPASGTSGAGASGPPTVPNPYFPIAVLPATYADADACSDAYSSCVASIRTCSAALQGSITTGFGGVTIVAPSGQGTTVARGPTTTLPASKATSVCKSLSTRACGTFSVEQCSIFGSGSSGSGNQNEARAEEVSKVLINMALVLVVAWQAGDIIDDWLAS